MKASCEETSYLLSRMHYSIGVTGAKKLLLFYDENFGISVTECEQGQNSSTLNTLASLFYMYI